MLGPRVPRATVSTTGGGDEEENEEDGDSRKVQRLAEHLLPDLRNGPPLRRGAGRAKEAAETAERTRLELKAAEAAEPKREDEEQEGSSRVIPTLADLLQLREEIVRVIGSDERIFLDEVDAKIAEARAAGEGAPAQRDGGAAGGAAETVGDLAGLLLVLQDVALQVQFEAKIA